MKLITMHTTVIEDYLKSATVPGNCLPYRYLRLTINDDKVKIVSYIHFKTGTKVNGAEQERGKTFHFAVN